MLNLAPWTLSRLDCASGVEGLKGPDLDSFP